MRLFMLYDGGRVARSTFLRRLITEQVLVRQSEGAPEGRPGSRASPRDELFYLPAYAPEHNRQRLNNDVKQKLRQKPQSDGKDGWCEHPHVARPDLSPASPPPPAATDPMPSKRSLIVRFILGY